MVDYVDTGLSANSVPYLTALEHQRAVHAEVASGRAPDTVILLEHPSVYTAGKRTEASERPTDGTPVIDVDRGGKITFVLEPKFDTPTAYEKDVDLVLEELKKAAK